MCLDSNEPATAVLLDFVPVSSGAGRASPYQAGQKINATVVYYHSTTPLRALLFEPTVSGDSAPTQMPVVNDSTETALNTFYEKRAANPWLNRWPVSISEASIQRSSDDRFWLTDANSSTAVALNSANTVSASVLLGLDDLFVHGLFDGKEIELLAASTPLGAWWSTT